MNAEILDALVKTIKEAITLEGAKIRQELMEDQKRMVIGLAKTTVRRDLDGAIADMEKRLQEKLTEQVKSIPTPQDGKDGQSVDMEVVKGLAEAWLADNFKQPEDGKDGTDGQDGKDAIQLDILPMIDASKTYAKGTYAQHDGGVYKASRNTDPIEKAEPHRAGWDMVLRGVSTVEVHPIDESTFAVKTKMTGGSDQVVKMSMPTMVYKEVWKDGETYQKGNVVTWGGSMWHCQKSDVTSKPATSDEWKLCVKRGTDGKDLNVAKLAKPDFYKLGAE